MEGVTAVPCRRWSTRVETIDHQELKWLACEWLIRQGARVVATEVSAPIPRWRVDVAGWLDGRDHRFHRPELDAPLFDGTVNGSEPVMTIAVECKQSRADFFRDTGKVDELVAERDRLERRCRELEETRIKVYEPHLRRSGSSLFDGLDEWDFAASRLTAYRTALAELRRTEEALYGETKFGLLPRYRLADRCVLFCPRGMVRPWEVPTGWGLIECGRRELRAGAARLPRDVPLPLRAARGAPHLGASAAHRDRWLRNIAIAATRSWMARDLPVPARDRDADEHPSPAADCPVD
jgi:hypothetical protein